MPFVLSRQSSLASILHDEYQKDKHPINLDNIDPNSPFAGQLEIRYSYINVDGQEVKFGETIDFSKDDPWSKLMISSVETLQKEGLFKGNITILEAGVGDGRNLLQAVGISQSGGSIDKEWTGRLIGIDIDPRRVVLARSNFESAGLGPRSFTLEGDAVRKIQDYAELMRPGAKEKVKGVALACLPQSPLDAETHSSADGFSPDLPSLARVKDIDLDGRPVAAYGLTLNAAWLLELRDCVEPGDFKLLIVVSDRVPRRVVSELFAKTGWAELRRFVTPEPTRQVGRTHFRASAARQAHVPTPNTHTPSQSPRSGRRERATPGPPGRRRQRP